MATLINGDGNAAVYAAQDADWFAGVEGNVTKILNIGLKMAYEIEDANTIAVKNGVIVTQEGRRIQIDAGSIDEFTIPTGSQGVTKYYIIGYHLYTDASSNQLCETFVQLMANDTDTIPEDTFRGGSDEVYVSLYRVTQDGITLSTVQSLLPEAATVKDIEDDIAGINASLTELRTLLWTNPNPSVDFAEQDIVLSSADYDELEIYFSYNATNNGTMYCMKMLKASNSYIYYVFPTGSGVSVRSRNITFVVDGTYKKYHFGVCSVGTGASAPSTENSICIPRFIYGIKYPQ